MKFKKGDTVRIRKDLENVLFDMPETFSEFCEYAGKKAEVVTVLYHFNSYILSVDGEKHTFLEEWLEPNMEQSIKKENHPMSAADILREISMLVEIMGLKEFDIQCTEGVINFTMAKNVEE